MCTHRWLGVALLSFGLVGCPESTPAVEPAPAAAEATAPATPDEATVAAGDYRPTCLDLEMQAYGAHQVPTELATLADEAHADSTLLLQFARAGVPSPTAAGHEPTGHVFRWTLREQIAEPRQRFRNDTFRARLAQLSVGVRHREGFENQQLRTLEARLRTQTQREVVLTVLNSREPGRPSTAALTCVDHGALAALTVAHFQSWSWLPPELAQVARVAPEARVRSLRTAHPQRITLAGATPSMRSELAELENLAISSDEDGSLQVTVVVDGD